MPTNSSDRIPSETVAELLGYQRRDIAILIAAGLLRPLGQPHQKSVKWFFREEIEALKGNRDFHDKATFAIQEHWRGQKLKREQKRKQTPKNKRDRQKSSRPPKRHGPNEGKA